MTRVEEDGLLITAICKFEVQLPVGKMVQITTTSFWKTKKGTLVGGVKTCKAVL